MEASSCERFQDEILSRGPISTALKEHLAVCKDCRGFQKVLGSLGLVSAAYPPAMLEGLRKKVLANSLPPAPGGASSTPIPAALTPLPLIAFAVAGCIMLGSILHFTGNRSDGPSPANGPVSPPGTRAMQVPPGTMTIQVDEHSVDSGRSTPPESRKATLSGTASAVIVPGTDREDGFK